MTQDSSYSTSAYLPIQSYTMGRSKKVQNKNTHCK